jgi:hypothetical protein
LVKRGLLLSLPPTTTIHLLSCLVQFIRDCISSSPSDFKKRKKKKKKYFASLPAVFLF